jgi:hypothetical protein
MTAIIIEIDCAPGGTRPNTHFSNIVSKLEELNKDNDKIVAFAKSLQNLQHISARFGNWEWKIEFNDENIMLKDVVQNHFKTHLTSLYNSGAIRYAGW